MGKTQNTEKLLLRRVAVATGAGLLAVVAGLGMAPAGAADDVSAEVEGSVDVECCSQTDDKGFTFTVQVTMAVGVEFEVGDIKGL